MKNAASKIPAAKVACAVSGICQQCQQYHHAVIDGRCQLCLRVLPMHDHWLETVHGNVIDFLEPNPDSIDVREIAWALSRTSRFVGHTITENPLSVAEHSVWVAQYLYAKTTQAWIALHGLLHDAHEAYTGDIPRPLKRIPAIHQGLKDVSERLQLCIVSALKLPPMPVTVADLIEEADMQALAVEALHVKGTRGIGWNLPPINDLARRIAPPTGCEAIIAYNTFINMYTVLHKLNDTTPCVH